MSTKKMTTVQATQVAHKIASEQLKQMVDAAMKDASKQIEFKIDTAINAAMRRWCSDVMPKLAEQAAVAAFEHAPIGIFNEDGTPSAFHKSMKVILETVGSEHVQLVALQTKMMEKLKMLEKRIESMQDFLDLSPEEVTTMFAVSSEVSQNNKESNTKRLSPFPMPLNFNGVPQGFVSAPRAPAFLPDDRPKSPLTVDWNGCGLPTV